MASVHKRGIMLAGGLPMDFPTISIHESFSQPTSMFMRNLMSMDTEEMIRAQPMDAIVLIGGCDKTVPHPIRFASLVSSDYRERARDEHIQMIEALRRGDRKALVALCAGHLLPSRDAYLSMNRLQFEDPA